MLISKFEAKFIIYKNVQRLEIKFSTNAQNLFLVFTKKIYKYNNDYYDNLS